MPDITGVHWLIEAFGELSTTRTYTFGGAANIPVTAIWQWYDRYGGPGWLVPALLEIDGVWLGMVQKNG
jgi:hypothetical protein